MGLRQLSNNRIQLMGILNVTPDSFSDGGEFYQPEIALTKVKSMIDKGAQIIDIGAQSTRPGAEEVGAKVELKRLLPVLNAIRSIYPEVIISVDTFHAEVAEATLEKGANWINDVSGGRRDSALLRLVAEAGCPYILTHSRGNSKNMDQLANYHNIGMEVKSEMLIATERAIAAGLNTSQIIWDPGLGFSKSTSQVVVLIRSLTALCAEGFPLLIGPSRKRFIGEILNISKPKDRISGTISVICHAISAGISIVRVHDIGPIAEIIKMSDVLLC
uniref:Dihydropteroate synthase n=1 Tax=Paulinella chromatophora TaxID=39717 RepID=B1X5K3_PAUCH|nr:dihydropteroate synthase [Paulinella chromatophora]ACB43222.1 dihydropteroate synthase [Paulinella chromatophora]